MFAGAGNSSGAPAVSLAPSMVQKVLLLAFFRVGSLVFSNSSLLLNSVTLFEVLRFTTIPLMCAVDYFVENRVYSMATYAALAGIVGGSAVATVTEVQFSSMGCVMGCLCAVFTVAYQCYNHHLQTVQGMSPTTLLLYETPFTVTATVLVAVVSGEASALPTVLGGERGGRLAILVGCSAALAVGINVTAYHIIGKTSAITYQGNFVSFRECVCVRVFNRLH